MDANFDIADNANEVIKRVNRVNRLVIYRLSRYWINLGQNTTKRDKFWNINVMNTYLKIPSLNLANIWPKSDSSVNLPQCWTDEESFDETVEQYSYIVRF